MNEINKTMPIVPLRGITVLPGMIIHFDISRKITVSAVEQAMLNNQTIFIVTQKEEEVESPNLEDLYSVGTVALIKQMIRLPDNIIRIMVLGIERARLDEVIKYKPFLNGLISVKEDTSLENLSELEIKAMLRNLKDYLKIYATENNQMGKNIVKQLMEISDLEKLVDGIANNLPLSREEKQQLLEEFELATRYEKVCILINEEIELTRIKKEFQTKVKGNIDKNQKEYLLREQQKVIREELGENNIESEADEYLSKWKKIKASKEVKDKIKIEIDRLKNISFHSSESSVVRGYIETLLALPWDKIGKDSHDLKEAAKILDDEHYGMKKIKERILEFLAVRVLTDKGDSPIICLVGPPGTGKTSIAHSIAKALNKKYVRICLGGVKDEAEIRGHRRTYIGAMPGRIAVGLKAANEKNPLMLLDEIDKVSSDYKGDTSSALLEVLDSEQNDKFIDHYIEIPMDLSEVFFIATANSVQTIPKPLLDRMEIIEVSSYTQNEKFHIAKEHLIKKQINKNGLQTRQLSISAKALEKIITGYTREAGVRNLERKIAQICRKAAKEILDAKEKADDKEKKQVKVTEKNLEKYLGKIKYTFDEANEEDEVGIVRGLAWTSAGGDTLQIEVNIMPGKGKLELTGQLGSVMKESAQISLSYVRSLSAEYNIDKDFFEKHDIHIHVPEGATPKDGPSAGITLSTAILSAVTNRKVKASVAMTGEVTLRGKVLAIGGLKEKILAAKTAKIKTVLIPEKNKKDIEEIEAEILDGIEIKFVEMMEQVLKDALVETETVSR